MAGVQEYYVDTQTGQTDLPLYDRWFKWAKFAVNWTTAVLALGTLVVRGTAVDSNPVVLGFFVLFTLLRTIEVAKETIPIFLCGQSFAWVQACCRYGARHTAWASDREPLHAVTDLSASAQEVALGEPLGPNGGSGMGFLP